MRHFADSCPKVGTREHLLLDTTEVDASHDDTQVQNNIKVISPPEDKEQEFTSDNRDEDVIWGSTSADSEDSLVISMQYH